MDTFAETVDHPLPLFDLVKEDIGKFAAAYFDESQALVPFPWKNLSFWKAWLKAQEVDFSLQAAGFNRSREYLADLADLAPEKALERMLMEMGIGSKIGQYLYLQRCNANVLGWGPSSATKNGKSR